MSGSPVTSSQKVAVLGRPSFLGEGLCFGSARILLVLLPVVRKPLESILFLFPFAVLLIMECLGSGSLGPWMTLWVSDPKLV